MKREHGEMDAQIRAEPLGDGSRVSVNGRKGQRVEGARRGLERKICLEE